MKKAKMMQAVEELEARRVDKKKAEIELAQIDFGLELKRVRESKNLNQRQLHEITGIDKTVLSELERGLYPPSLPLIKQLSDGLEINPHILVAAYYGIPLPEFNVGDKETLDTLIKIALDYAARQNQSLPPLTQNETPITPKGEKALNAATVARRKKKIDKPKENNP